MSEQLKMEKENVRKNEKMGRCGAIPVNASQFNNKPQGGCYGRKSAFH